GARRVAPPRAAVAEAPETPRLLRFKPDDRLPPPGSGITRPYKGDDLQVKVLTEGFEFEGTVYPSLSAVAHAVTGSHMNGFAFFRPAPKAGARVPAWRSRPRGRARRSCEPRSTRGSPPRRAWRRSSTPSIISARRARRSSKARPTRAGPAPPSVTMTAATPAPISIDPRSSGCWPT